MTHSPTMMVYIFCAAKLFPSDSPTLHPRAVKEFANYFKCPPDRLNLEHIRIFQAHLFSDRKLSSNTVNQHLAALRFSRLGYGVSAVFQYRRKVFTKKKRKAARC